MKLKPFVVFVVVVVGPCTGTCSVDVSRAQCPTRVSLVSRFLTDIATVHETRIWRNSPFHGYFFSFALQCNLACM